MKGGRWSCEDAKSGGRKLQGVSLESQASSSVVSIIEARAKVGLGDSEEKGWRTAMKLGWRKWARSRSR
jgi:hypothetical protein